ncbi:MAG TPA: hypothetical protein VGN54_07260 [Mycobacteriales bacterium]|jgi:hypothetical protein|nr:hypothetical protein [Mycobacteriales bacterium]
MSTPALVEAACKKGGLLWVAVGEHEARAVWYLWDEGKAYVLTGGGEQQVPGLAEASAAVVTARSADKGGRLVTWRARCTRIPADSARWAELQPQLIKARLNTPDGPDAPARWAASSVLTELAPDGAPLEAPGAMPADGGFARPRPTPATTKLPLPWVLGRRRTR